MKKMELNLNQLANLEFEEYQSILTAEPTLSTCLAAGPAHSSHG